MEVWALLPRRGAPTQPGASWKGQEAVPLGAECHRVEPAASFDPVFSSLFFLSPPSLGRCLLLHTSIGPLLLLPERPLVETGRAAFTGRVLGSDATDLKHKIGKSNKIHERRPPPPLREP